MKKSLIVFLLLLLPWTAFAGISTKDKDTLKLLGTSFAVNGKFAWIELNGKNYGWTKKGGNVGKYKILIVEMGKVIVESRRKTLVLLMLEQTQSEIKL